MLLPPKEWDISHHLLFPRWSNLRTQGHSIMGQLLRAMPEGQEDSGSMEQLYCGMGGDSGEDSWRRDLIWGGQVHEWDA
jgi:hypothetical protein